MAVGTFLPRLLAVAAVLGVSSPTQQPNLDVAALATGPYSRMHMLYERTIFAVDVLTLELRFGEPTRAEFERLAAGRAYSPDLAARISAAALNTRDVFVRLEFQRGVSLSQWLGGARDGLAQGWRAGMIDEQTYRHVSSNLPRWFQVIADRGFEDGDAILYRGYGDRMRTVLVSATGKVLLDQTDPGASPQRALLSGYFAPDTDFREPLVRSLLTSHTPAPRVFAP